MQNPRIPVQINGKAYTLALDMAALMCLKREFNISIEQLADLRKVNLNTRDADAVEMLLRLVYAMAQSNDEPPTWKDVQRMTLADVAVLVHAVKKAAERGFDLGLPGENRAANVTPARSSVSRGIGTKRSTRRSTASGSRRQNSAG